MQARRPSAYLMIKRRTACPKPSARCHGKPWRACALAPSPETAAKNALSLIPVTLLISARISRTCDRATNPQRHFLSDTGGALHVRNV